MTEIPPNLKYTESHEWVLVEEDGTVTVGITDNAQEALGDLVFVELPGVGEPLNVEDACGVVESVGPGSARVSVRESRTGQSWDVHWLLLERVKEGNNGSHRR